MRKVCRECLAYKNARILPCTGDDKACYKVMLFDEGYDTAINDAVELYREEMIQCDNLVKYINKGVSLVDVERSVNEFRNKLEMKYLESKIKKATPKLKDVNTDELMHELRSDDSIKPIQQREIEHRIKELKDK